MEKEMFNELLESVQEMDEIVKDKKKASRQFDFPEPEVKAIREKPGSFARKVCSDLRSK